MSAKIRITFGLCILAVFFIEPATAQHAYAVASDCVSAPCIDMLSDPITGEIIGRGTSITPGRAGKRTTVTKRRVAKKKSPVLQPNTNPICTVDQLLTFTCIKTTSPVAPPPVVPRAISTPPKPTVVATDEVRRALPRARLGFQPAAGTVVNLPVIFWSGLVTPVRFSLTLLGHSVDVNMNARFQWSWGDGQYLTTTSVGAPFPSQSLTHTYRQPGRYRVSVITTWSGSAFLGQTSLQIVGAPIETVDQTEVVVSQAPTVLTTVQ